VAAIDVGTISVRLLVADLIAGRPQHVLKQVEVTRLGEGLRPGVPLEEAAARRTAAVARSYVQEARRLGASEITLAGTSAARDAADGRQFIATLGGETRVTAVVLSGAEEARLAYAGASLDVEGDFVVLDVGGGSTELIRGTPEGNVEAVSLDIGATERPNGGYAPIHPSLTRWSRSGGRLLICSGRRAFGSAPAHPEGCPLTPGQLPRS
jgi:exopolyphosphatase/guanosine-5'-triphosphate,3'-diphosphate pyrophosphatase